MSSPAFCTASPTLATSESFLAWIRSRAAFCARVVFPMSFATLRCINHLINIFKILKYFDLVSYFYYLAKYQPISIMRTILKKHKVVVCVTYQVGDDCAHFVHVLLHLSLLLIHLARLLCSCHEAVVRVQTWDTPLSIITLLNAGFPFYFR